MRLTNEARVELRANLKQAIAEVGDSATVTPAMVNAATKAELLAWASRYNVALPASQPGDLSPTEATDAAIEEQVTGPANPALSIIPEANYAPAPDVAIDALVAADVAELQRLVAVMDGAAFKEKATALARLAHKPAEIVTVEASQPGQPAKVPQARRTGSDTLKNLFGVTGQPGKIAIDTWQSAASPAVDPHYVWPADISTVLIKLFHYKKNVLFVGPAGTGKTSLAEQLAAKLGRPFVRISFHPQIEATEIFGQRIITAENGMVWADGLLPMAMQTPGTIILCDELDRARPGMLQSLQSVFDSRKITFPETGHTVKCAEGVVFVCAGNTNGTGDTTGQYTAAQQLDRSTLDRMADTVRIDYLPADKEAGILVAKTGCPQTLADLLVHFAGVTRLDVAKGELPHGMGYRRLESLSQSLIIGIDPASAVSTAMLNTVGPDELEKLAALVKTHLSPSVIRRALKGENVLAPQGQTGRGAQDFTPVSE